MNVARLRVAHARRATARVQVGLAAVCLSVSAHLAFFLIDMPATKPLEEVAPEVLPTMQVTLAGIPANASRRETGHDHAAHGQRPRKETPSPPSDAVSRQEQALVGVTHDGDSEHAPSVPQPEYYRASELSARAALLQDLPPSFGLQGVPAQTVILRLFINEEGSIDRIDPEQSYLPQEQQEALLEAFSNIRFEPGRIGEQAVKSQMRIEVKLDDSMMTG